MQLLRTYLQLGHIVLNDLVLDDLHILLGWHLLRWRKWLQTRVHLILVKLAVSDAISRNFLSRCHPGLDRGNLLNLCVLLLSNLPLLTRRAREAMASIIIPACFMIRLPLLLSISLNSRLFFARSVVVHWRLHRHILHLSLHVGDHLRSLRCLQVQLLLRAAV